MRVFADANVSMISITQPGQRARRSLPAVRKRDIDKPIIRSLDITIAIVALIFISPLLLVVIVVLAFEGGPVIFAHRRVGLGGNSFYCLKFRSMVVDAEERLSRLLRDDPEAQQEWLRDHKLRNDPRITRFGQFLRRSSVDELPQLLNVLRGEMSIVGPRPIVDAELPRYGRRISSYYAVKPGITGIWQVSGRNQLSFNQWMYLDMAYIDHWSLTEDLRLLLQTIPVVFSGKGAS